MNEILSENKDGKEKYNYILQHYREFSLIRSLLLEIVRRGIPSGNTRNIIDKNQTVEVDGNKYMIPKGSTILLNAAAINHNQEYWCKELGKLDAMVFDPRRFIDNKTGKMINVKNSHLMGFGAGRRSCVGPDLAQREVVLGVCMLIERYIFKIPKKYKSKEDYVIPNILFDKSKIVGVDVIKRE